VAVEHGQPQRGEADPPLHISTTPSSLSAQPFCRRVAL